MPSWNSARCVPQMRIWAASVQATFERTFFNPGYLGSTRVEEIVGKVGRMLDVY